LKETSKSFLLLGWIVAILFIVKCSGGGGIPDPCQFIPKDSPLCKSLNCPACINPPVPTTTTTTTTLPPDPIPPTPFPTPKPTPSPIPPPKECQKLSQPSACPELHTGIFKGEVNNALSKVTGCNIGSDCLIINYQTTIIELMTELNKDYCTSYDLQGGNKGFASELGIRNSVEFTEYYQPITANSKARWADSRSICKPAFDEEILSEVIAAWGLPVPSPSPSPGICPVKVEGDYFVDLVISKIGGNPQLWTATAKYCGFPVRSDIFKNCGTKCCTLGVDGDSGNGVAIACEAELSGPPTWFVTGSLAITQFGDNPYNVKVISGAGTLKACGKSGCSNIVSF